MNGSIFQLDLVTRNVTLLRSERPPLFGLQIYDPRKQQGIYNMLFLQRSVIKGYLQSPGIFEVTRWTKVVKRIWLVAWEGYFLKFQTIDVEIGPLIVTKKWITVLYLSEFLLCIYTTFIAIFLVCQRDTV